MKKFLTALLALMLALAMAFTMVACANNSDVNGGDNGGNNGGNENTGNGDNEENKPEPVSVKEFMETILENISTAEGFSVTLDGTFTGTYTVGDAEPVDVSGSNFADQSSVLDKDYATRIISVLDDVYGLLGDIDIEGIDIGGILDSLTVPATDSGYEFSFTINKALMTQLLAGVNNFFATVGQKTLYTIVEEALNSQPSTGETDNLAATETGEEWFNRLLAADNTIGNIVTQLKEVLPSNIDFDKIVRIITGIANGNPQGLNDALKTLVLVDEEKATIDYNVPEGTEGAVAISEVKISTLVESLMQAPGMYAFLQPMILSVLSQGTVSQLYNIVVSIVCPMVGMTFMPTTGVFETATIDDKSYFTIKVATDKELKLTSFSVKGLFTGNCVFTDLTDSSLTTAYSANDITVDLSGTFGYEAIAA